MLWSIPQTMFDKISSKDIFEYWSNVENFKKLLIFNRTRLKQFFSGRVILLKHCDLIWEFSLRASYFHISPVWEMRWVEVAWWINICAFILQFVLKLANQWSYFENSVWKHNKELYNWEFSWRKEKVNRSYFKNVFFKVWRDILQERDPNHLCQTGILWREPLNWRQIALVKVGRELQLGGRLMVLWLPTSNFQIKTPVNVRALLFQPVLSSQQSLIPQFSDQLRTRHSYVFTWHLNSKWTRSICGQWNLIF